MEPLGYLIVILSIATPLAWLVSEFKENRILRISLGILSLVILVSFFGLFNDMFTRFKYNSQYGGATSELIKTSIHQIEDGKLDRVLKVWHALDRQYQPTYENQAGYIELVEEANRKMRDEQPSTPNSAWDASLFDAKTWEGHWENETGYWIVINNLGQRFDIVRSGDPTTKMQFVSISPDFKVLTFNEDNLLLHTLTLKNKYEAIHEWTDVSNGTKQQADALHKLIRASEEQKRVTQQEKPINESKLKTDKNGN